MMTYSLHRKTFARNTRRQRSGLMALIIVLSLAVSGLAYRFSLAATMVSSPSENLLITGLQTGGCVTFDAATSKCVAEDTKMEYIELYNPQAEMMQISQWVIQYVSPTGTSHTDLATLNGSIAGHGYVLVAHAGYYTNQADATFGNVTDSSGKLAKTAGHVRVIDSSSNVVDVLGWDKSATMANGTPIKAIDPGKAVERVNDSAGNLVDTRNNIADFSVTITPSPLYGGYTLRIDTPDPMPNPTPVPDPAPTQEPVPNEPTTSCEGLVLNEVMPNPGGTDTNHEFIELYNPATEPLTTDGCSIETRDAKQAIKTYTFKPSTLDPGAYKAYYAADFTSGTLSLTNATGLTITLLAADDSELGSTSYPDDMADDVAWINNNQSWASTYTSTPGAANILTASQPCPEGQIRNIDTNRCNNIALPSDTSASSQSNGASATTDTLAPCKANQSRNPDTNRCRNNATASAVAACPTGQERNPETNRCKASASAAPTTKSCPEGQERNPNTNRCRKIAATAASSKTAIHDVKDVAANSLTSNMYWIIAGIALLAAGAYGIYEWRQEIVLFATRHLGRFSAQTAQVSATPVSTQH